MTALKIKSLDIVNALCFDKLSINFEDAPVTQIIGENGVGKSSIPTLLEECLYNKNSRGLAKGDLLNRYTNVPNYRLIVHFMKGSDGYMVDKEVKSTTKVVLIKNGKDISGHTATQTYKLIQEIIGLDFATFTKLIYQSMESSLDFLKATDATRKKFFLGLFNLSEYSETEEKLKAAYTETKKELDTTKTKMDTIKSWLNRDTEYQRREKRTITPLDISELEDRIVELKIELSNLERSNGDAREEQERRNHLARVKNIAVAPCTDNSEELKVSMRAWEEQNKINIGLSTEYGIAKKEVASASNYHENCPTCGHALEFESAARVLEDARDKLAVLEVKMKDAISKLTQFAHSLKEEQQEQKVYVKYKKYCDTLRDAEAAVDISKLTQITDGEELKKELSKIQLEVQMRKDDYEADINYNNLVDSHNAKVDSQEEQTRLYNEELSLHISKLTQITEIESDLKILKESFSGKGLINFKIESLIKAFEEEINNNLVRLSDGQFNLSFGIEDSKLKLKMYSHSEEVSIKSLSTGEFNKVNMASLLAVRNMMAKLSDVSVNVLFLDEVISVLSPTSLETLIEDLLKRDLNTFIVSHGYAHPLAEEILLVKENNISGIKE